MKIQKKIEHIKIEEQLENGLQPTRATFGLGIVLTFNRNSEYNLNKNSRSFYPMCFLKQDIGNISYDIL